jgi:hypothetical protein
MASQYRTCRFESLGGHDNVKKITKNKTHLNCFNFVQCLLNFLQTYLLLSNIDKYKMFHLKKNITKYCLINIAKSTLQGLIKKRYFKNYCCLHFTRHVYSLMYSLFRERIYRKKGNVNRIEINSIN